MTADTHVPKRARTLPAELWTAIEAADVVIHAGDWVDLALLDEMETRSARLIGVYGNNDGRALRARLPEIAGARLATGEERRMWWERAVSTWPDYDAYQQRTSREIPVFVLTAVG